MRLLVDILLVLVALVISLLALAILLGPIEDATREDHP